jgi:parallel beta-helix repeat protein
MKSFSQIFHITLFILLITLTLKLQIQPAKSASTIITVPDDYTKIQWAIGNATIGDIIYIRSGTYYEHLTINKPLILMGENKENTMIDGSGKNQTIIQVTANNVTITGITVQNSSRTPGTSYAGIKISSNTCNITGNYITKTKIGIFVTSQKSTITKNIVKNNGHGIALHSSSEVIVESNNVSANTVGISLALSYNNIITNNKAVNSSIGGHGITLSDSFDNTIDANELANNFHGIWLSSSSNNSIVKNTIANNKLLGIELANSSNNTFYHNNFINNPKHIVIDNKSISIWNDKYPSGGNFWDTYIGVDETGDNIGETPYIINTNNQDNYPLITPAIWNYRNPVPIIWEGTIYPVAISTNSTISMFQFNQPQMQINFNTTGPPNTIGFCNVTIPKTLLNDNPWTITIDDQPPTNFTSTNNATHSFLYFTYTHNNTQTITIQGTSAIPEFPTLVTSPLTYIVIPATLTLTIAITLLQKHKEKNKKPNPNNN